MLILLCYTTQNEIQYLTLKKYFKYSQFDLLDLPNHKNRIASSDVSV